MKYSYKIMAIAIILTSTMYAKLPEGYGEIDYVAATGAQWIDTGYIFTKSNNMEVEFDAEFTTRNPYRTLWYARNYGSGYRVGFSREDTNNRGKNVFRCVYGKSDKYYIDTRVPYKRRLFRMVDGDYYFDDELIVETSKESYTLDRSVCIFANYYNSKGELAYAKLYGAKGWTRINGVRTLVMDLVPATNNVGDVGVYDLVRNMFITSGTSTPLVAPKGEKVYSKVDSIKDPGTLTLATSWSNDLVPQLGYDYVLTNQLRGVNNSSSSILNPIRFNGDSLQIGIIGGKDGELRGSHKECIPRLILAKGTIIASGQQYTGGITYVLSKSDAPFCFGCNWGSLAFLGEHEFSGDEDAVLKVRQWSWNEKRYTFTIGSDSPKYYGKWDVSPNASRVVLSSPMALGGERENFAADALNISGPSNDNNTEINANYNSAIYFNFNGTMPSKGRGITINRTRSLTEFIVYPGKTIHCDMPIVAKTPMILHTQVSTSSASDLARFSIGDWEEGSSLMVSNVAVRIPSIGEDTAATLTISNNAAFWAEVDSDNVNHYSNIKENTTLITSEDKIKICLDCANAVDIDGNMVVTNEVEIPVLKIDTAVRVVKKDDFVLANESVEFTKPYQHFRVILQGTTQTVNWVAEPSSLILIIR